MKKILTAAVALMLLMTMAVLTACTSDNDNNPASGTDSRIVGKWCSDVSGTTYAKWNYGETWQSTEFKADDFLCHAQVLAWKETIYFSLISLSLQ